MIPCSSKCSRRNTPSSCFKKLLVCFREWRKTRYNHRKLKSVRDANSSLSLMADKPSQHPCSSSDPSSSGARGGAGNRPCLAGASGQERGADAPRDLLSVGEQRGDCSRSTVGLCCSPSGRDLCSPRGAGRPRLGCSSWCVADPAVPARARCSALERCWPRLCR